MRAASRQAVFAAFISQKQISQPLSKHETIDDVSLRYGTIRTLPDPIWRLLIPGGRIVSQSLSACARGA